ncbi:exo-beta-1,3-glucanase [Magnetospirillum sp. SS-4]|uniref:glycoside hydrolase family 17 protein n=1 Tax=Magnetospirillum sp. SS-4 TaxID=2681465 RepID=UPI00137D6C94|nr:exo-beta-1,3-glucanase [Magnetospirillum sp. SS-4]CAA7613878.1 Exo-beta-1,3-glucanase [Magnetospirillum sp. SS-4]
MTRFRALLFITLLGVANVAGWWWFNRPIPVELSFDEPFPSVSFAPFRRGQSPITKVFPPPEQIVEDMESLVGVTRGVRTYTSQEGMDVVPAVAGRLGLEVTHSAWLGRKAENNDLEVEALIRAANRHPDSIRRVIVGNEVLLRQDLTADQLAAHIRRVKAAVKQPVSYADVWAFWLKNPQLAQEVDFITIHILPYWEDEPVGVDGAAEYLVKIYRRVAEAFPGKPILIGEAGWPTRGRSRGPAVASMENGARFVRTLARVSRENGFDYNVVEAFDQPWKAQLEGTVGAYWGVVDAQRRVKFAMSGPVHPNPSWAWHGAIATILGAGAALVFLRRPERYAAAAGLAVTILAQLAATLVVWQAIHAQALAYDTPGDVWAWVRIALHATLAVVVVRAAGRSFRTDAAPVMAGWSERLMPLYAFSAICVTALLLFNGRYRDIPPADFLMPCVGVTAFALARMAVLSLSWRDAFAVGRLFGQPGPGGVAPIPGLAVGLMLSVVAAPMSEAWALARGEDFIQFHPAFSDQFPLLVRALWENAEMVTWTVMLAVMAIPFLAEWRRSER